MVNHIARIALFWHLKVYLIGFGRSVRLRLASGQGQKTFKVFSVISQYGLRIARWVDCDEDWRHIKALCRQQRHSFCIAGIVERANIGARGVAKIDQRGFSQQSGIGNRVTFGVG